MWFHKYILPVIAAKVDDVTLCLVGPSLPLTVRLIVRGKRVQHRGYVDDKIKALMSATIAIAPLRSGSGMQNKVLEAVACGVPIVCTSYALAGFEKPHDYPLILHADSEQDFAAACIGALNNPCRQSDIETSKKNLATNYSWDQHMRTLNGVYTLAGEADNEETSD
jgi:glycosyltransferase involved in cell wall biosynthesis